MCWVVQKQGQIAFLISKPQNGNGRWSQREFEQTKKTSGKKEVFIRPPSGTQVKVQIKDLEWKEAAYQYQY